MLNVLNRVARIFRPKPAPELVPDFKARLNWADRWAHYKGTPWENLCLLSIAEECNELQSGERDIYVACIDCASETDPECRAEFIREIELTFAEWDAEERAGERIYRWEQRNRRDIPDMLAEEIREDERRRALSTVN